MDSATPPLMSAFCWPLRNYLKLTEDFIYSNADYDSQHLQREAHLLRLVHLTNVTDALCFQTLPTKTCAILRLKRLSVNASTMW